MGHGIMYGENVIWKGLQGVFGVELTNLLESRKHLVSTK